MTDGDTWLGLLRCSDSDKKPWFSLNQVIFGVTWEE